MSLNFEDWIIDLDILIYAIGSAQIAKKSQEEVTNLLQHSKNCLKSYVPQLRIVQSFFDREFTPPDFQKNFLQSMVEECVNPIRQQTSILTDALKQLNYPLPTWLIADISLIGNNKEINSILNFELRVFAWIQNLQQHAMEYNEFKKLSENEDYSELHMSIPANNTLLGWLTYTTILNEWNHKDIRLNNTLNQIIKDIKPVKPNLIIRNEFLSRKIGLIIVFQKSND